MYKDRFEIEKEQRLQNRVMGCCAVAVIVFLVLVIVCAGCSSHKAATAAETAYTADSVQTAVVATVEKRGMSWGWLQTLCDSINARWTADSVTAPYSTSSRRVRRPSAWPHRPSQRMQPTHRS